MTSWAKVLQRSTLSVTGGTLALMNFIVLIRQPLLGDDQILPYAHLSSYGYWSLRDFPSALLQATGGGHVNIIGQAIGLVITRAIIELCIVGVDYWLIYRIIRILAIALLVIVVSLALGKIGGHKNHRLLLASLFVSNFGALTISRQLWSTDGVNAQVLTSYVLAIITLTVCLTTSVRLRLVLIVFGSLYYEAVAVLILLPLWHVLKQSAGEMFRRRVGLVVGGSIGAALSLIWLVNAAYDGMRLEIDRSTMRNVAISITSLVPSSALFRLLRDSFSVEILLLGVAHTVMIVITVFYAIKLYAKESSEIKLLIRNLLSASLLLVIIHPMSGKGSDLFSSLGDVYLSHHASIAMLSVILVLLFSRQFCGLRMHGKYAYLVLGLLVISLWSNLRISSTLDERTSIHRNLAASTSEIEPDLRCDALGDWLLGAWPPYYEEQLVLGLERMSVLRYGQAFCNEELIRG